MWISLPQHPISDKVRELSENKEAAVECGPWNSCDLGNNEGLKLQLERIRLQRPQHVWLAPMCDSYSALQNLNNKTPEQKAQVLQQRQVELKGLVGMACVVRFSIQLVIHVTVEIPERSQAWRLPICQQLFTKQGLYSAVTKGRSVNYRDPRNQQFIQRDGDLQPRTVGWLRTCTFLSLWQTV